MFLVIDACLTLCWTCVFFFFLVVVFSLTLFFLIHSPGFSSIIYQWTIYIRLLFCRRFENIHSVLLLCFAHTKNIQSIFAEIVHSYTCTARPISYTQYVFAKICVILGSIDVWQVSWFDRSLLSMRQWESSVARFFNYFNLFAF